MIREASKNELQSLKNFLITKGFVGLTFVSLFEIEEEFDFSRPFYVSDSDPQSFIFATKIFSALTSFSIFWDNEKIDDEELKLYLKAIPNWNWNQKFSLSFLEINLASKLHNIFVGGEICSKLKTTYSELCLAYEVNPETLEKISPPLPNGFVFGELQSKHLPYVFEHWSDSFTESVENFEKFICIFPTSAIFEGDATNTNPIAWVALYSFGHIGVLFTHPNYRRRGFAGALLNNLCSKLKNKNIRLITQVGDFNKTSQNFHHKIGAKFLGNSYWNVYDVIS